MLITPGSNKTLEELKGSSVSLNELFRAYSSNKTLEELKEECKSG